MSLSRLVVIFVFLSISLVRAQQQDVAPPNVDSILKEIEALELKQKQGKISERNALFGAIQSASASGPAAANFYTQAVEEVNFKGKKDKVEAFIAWKKSHSDLLRSKEMQTALLLHLKYLISHFEKHKEEGSCQLRLYADILLLDKNNKVEFPDKFIKVPKQEMKKEYRRAAWKKTVAEVPAKYRFRFIIGDIFPSVSWMRRRYKCNAGRAMLYYPVRIGKLGWLM